MMVLTESFPVGVDGLCTGIVEGMAQIGFFAAPMLVNYAINIQLHPILLLSVFVLAFCMIPISFYKPKEVSSTQEDDSMEMKLV